MWCERPSDRLNGGAPYSCHGIGGRPNSKRNSKRVRIPRLIFPRVFLFFVFVLDADEGHPALNEHTILWQPGQLRELI
jgi:hypothetical protein